MTPDLQKEFQLLSVTAKQLLKGVPASGSYRQVCSIWIWPSFAPAIRWTIYLPRPFASATIWRSDLDGKKLESPVERLKYPKDLVPTIEHETISLTAELIQEFENNLKGISIPIFLGTPSVVGCDGTLYEFSCGKLFYGASIIWWENFPAEWRPFTEAVMKIIQNLESRRTMKSPADPSDEEETTHPAY